VVDVKGVFSASSVWRNVRAATIEMQVEMVAQHLGYKNIRVVESTHAS
jgi:hypothetical protein